MDIFLQLLQIFGIQLSLKPSSSAYILSISIVKWGKNGPLLINVVLSCRHRVLLDILILEAIGLLPKTQRYRNLMISECISLVIFIFRCPFSTQVIGVNTGHYLDKYGAVSLFTLSLRVIHGVKVDTRNFLYKMNTVISQSCLTKYDCFHGKMQ